MLNYDGKIKQKHFWTCLVLFSCLGCQKSSFRRDEQIADTPPLAEPIEPNPIIEPLPQPIKPQPIEPQAIEPQPIPTSPLFQDCDKDSSRHFVADLYPLAKDTQRLPDFKAMKATKTLCLLQLNITDRDFKEGFPGVEGLIEWFALDIRFKIRIPETGSYTFYLNSDDGSRLIIDGKSLINNDGQHSQQEESATITLSAGEYLVQIPYFQGPATRIALELKWRGPNVPEKSYIPLTLIQKP